MRKLDAAVILSNILVVDCATLATYRYVSGHQDLLVAALASMAAVCVVGCAFNIVVWSKLADRLSVRFL